MKNILSPILRVVDVLHHVKSRTDDGYEEKVEFPITRYENVLGAPRIVTPDDVASAHVSDYAIYVNKEMYITDEEYAACFADLL